MPMIHLQRSIACECTRPQLPREELAKRDAVFIGKAVDIQLDTARAIFRVTLQVSSYWKGVASSPVIVRTPAGSAACGFDFTVDSSYLVYADQSDSGFWTNICTRTVNLAGAAYDLSELGPPTVVSVNNAELKAYHFRLYQNYPNPFNPQTTFEFSLPESRFVSLNVCDVLGREVASLVSDVLHAGSYMISWDAGGQPGGVYYYRLTAGGFSRTWKAILAK